MANSKADELRKLADLRTDGILSEKEYQEQKRQLLRSDPRGSWPMHGQFRWALVVGAIAIVLAGGLAALISRPGGPEAVALTAASTSQVEGAITWAEGKLDPPNTEYARYDELLCLEFVADAWLDGAKPSVNIGGFFSEDDPVTYWKNEPTKDGTRWMGWPEVPSKNGAYNDPPAGALVFWGGTTAYPDGHVALSLGSNEVISTWAAPEPKSTPNVFTFTLSQRNPSVYPYLGYMMPMTAAGSASSVATAAPASSSLSVEPKSSGSGLQGGSGSGLQGGGGGSSLQPAGGESLQPAAPIPATQNTTPTKTPTPTLPPSTPTLAPTPVPATAPPAPTPAPTTAPPAPQLYWEVVGSPTHTWTDYGDAAGSEGAEIDTGTPVQVTCRVQGFKVADGNTWWYQIASPPWDNAYYASADAFYNNGESSGSLAGTPFYDPAVPVC